MISPYESFVPSALADDGNEQFMKRKQLKFGQGFKVVFGNARSQAAQMVIAPGAAEGGPRNRHRGADQWLYVVSGRGIAMTGRRKLPLRAGSLLLIEHGNQHEIRNNGRTVLKTLNFYVPPAYRKSGDELSRAKP
jgi:mannose-6-phosphate isomerase-like protein (cupin superfamily)